MASLFTRIINGEIPCHKVAETADFLAFLDIAPCALGHTLVVPKKEVDYIFELDEATYLGLMQFARTVATAIEKAIPCQRIGMAVIGLEVPHAHLHLIPINSMSDMDFGHKRKVKPEELATIAAQIRALL